MFNVTVLKMKDIIKYLVGIIITIAFVIYTARYFSSIKNKVKEEEKKQSKIEIFQFGSLTSCLDKTIPTMSSVNEEYNKIEQENEKIASTNYLEEFLKTEISTIKGIEKIETSSNSESTNEKLEENEENNQTEQIEEITLASTGETKTEVVTQNPITESYNVEYGKVKIKNETDYELTRRYFKSRH